MRSKGVYMQKFLQWCIRKLVTYYYKHYPFYVYSWGLDDNTDLYVMSEESYHDKHRFGLKEEIINENGEWELVR